MELGDSMDFAREAETNDSSLCPYCPVKYESSQLRRHIGRHLQQLALFALPRPTNDDEYYTGKDDRESLSGRAWKDDSETVSKFGSDLDDASIKRMTESLDTNNSTQEYDKVTVQADANEFEEGDGSTLFHRYQRTGNLPDLGAAIAHGEAIVEATPEDHPDKAGRLSNLGTMLFRRYERMGNLHDLEAAITHGKTAVETTPEDHSDKAGLLSSLGNMLFSRYKRTGNLQDLEAAHVYGEAAVEATPEDHPEKAGRLSSLGTILLSQDERTGNLKTLEAAIVYAEAAVTATPENHPEKAKRISGLGTMLFHRSQRTGNLRDLEAAIAHGETAVEATQQDHPDKAELLNNLGVMLKTRYQRTGNLQDLEAAIAHTVAAWNTRTGPILTRLQSAFSASQMLIFNSGVQDLSKAYLLLYNAIHLLPLATPRFLDREDQQQILEKLPGLTSLAIAISLEVRQPPLEALRLLELGHSVTNSQLLDYRSDITNLREQYPILAEAFDSLRSELDSPLLSTDQLSENTMDQLSENTMDQYLMIQQVAIRRRKQVANGLDDILQRIRQKPGFENFLLAQSKEYLLSSASEGPIVVLNFTKLRSDAILVTQERVTSIALPQLSSDSIKEHFLPQPSPDSMDKYFGVFDVSGTAFEDNATRRGLLEWLWKAAVQPVLQELGFYPKVVDPLPRIWWIGVGLMARAPIHAATKYKKYFIKMTTLQYCIPSYTSTIRALQYSRSRQKQLNSSMKDMLIATMPTPRGYPLDVDKEADNIKNCTGDYIPVVRILRKPTAKQLLEMLPNYSIAHFACHGVSSINPAESHLLLVKQSTSPDGHPVEVVDKLRVKDIAALKLPAARLAYLSACNTARSPESKLADEVTHLVSAFHIAGFPHVIGSMGPVEDARLKIAPNFYSKLRETDNVAESYRYAIMELMKQKPLQPGYWAPFIHFGA